MAARQPRRTRRRNVPAETLPSVRTGRAARPEVAPGSAASQRTGQPEHEVTSDYRYVWHEMGIIAGVSAFTFGLIVVLSFII